MKNFLTLVRNNSLEMSFDSPFYFPPVLLKNSSQKDEYFSEQTASFQDSQAKICEQKISKKITKKSCQTIKKSNAERDYKKNICRNILRHAIKSITYISEDLKVDIQEFSNYYNQNLESITGFRVLRDHLMINSNDSLLENIRKQNFKKYLTWFLSSRASVQIIGGEVTNPREYLKYKNEVLLYYVQRPEEWSSNSATWRTTTSTTTTPPIFKYEEQVELQRFQPHQTMQYT